MFWIIDDKNKEQHQDLLDQMHRLRYRVFVEQLGWTLPCGNSGYDIDEFDNANTRYLILTDDETGRVLASGRFNPTVKPHLMSEMFADHCNLMGLQTGDNIWEYTRYAFDFEAIGKDRFREVRAMFGVAQTEFAIQTGMDQLVWLSAQSFYGDLIKHWPSVPLGTPKFNEADNNYFIAAISDIGDEALRRMHARLGREELFLTGAIPYRLQAA